MADKTSKFVNPKGRPVGPKVEELYECQNCGALWREDSLKPAEDMSQRFDDGEIMSHYECPDPECGALCFPAKGEPAEIVIGLYATQSKILKIHDGHTLRVRVVKGKVHLLCEDCGNNATRVVDENEISKADDEG